MAGNFLGTDAAGGAAAGNVVGVESLGADNTVGGTAPADRNVIAGNTAFGVLVGLANLSGSGVQGSPVVPAGNVIQGNFIGTNAAGAGAVPNGQAGVKIVDAPDATVGGTAAGAGNVVSGNTGAGIEVGAARPVIQGNRVGTDVTGTAPLPNQVGLLTENSGGATIGGTAAGAGNVVAANRSTGIDLSGSFGNLVQGNLIGTDPGGGKDLGNTDLGVKAGTAFGTTIGGTAAGAGNVIAFTKAGQDGGAGVQVNGTDVALVLGNSIFENEGPGIVGGFSDLTLTSATAASIRGTLDGGAGDVFRLEFFATPITDEKSADEGKALIGSLQVTIGPGDRVDFTFTPVGGVPAGQHLTASATPTSRAGATKPFSNPLQVAPEGPSADLGVTVSDAPDPVAAGSDLTYSIRVTNIGPDPAQGVALTTAVPAGTTFVSFVAPPGWTPTAPAVGGTGAVTASIGQLAAGTVNGVVFTLVVRVDPAAGDGSAVSLTASVDGGTTDPDAANDVANVTTIVTGAPPLPDLTLSVADAPDPVAAGETITYTLTASKTGPGLEDIQLASAVPAGSTFVSFAAPEGWTPTVPAVGATGSITAFTGFLRAGADPAVFTLVVRVDTGAAAGSTINVTGEVGSIGLDDPTPADNKAAATTTVAASASGSDLAVTVADSPDPVAAGATITYAITARNDGPNSNEGVTLSTDVPAGTTLVSFVAPEGWTITAPAAGGVGSITAVFDGLGFDPETGGESANFTLVVRVNPDAGSSTIALTARVASGTTDPNADNDTAAAITTVSATPPTNAAPSAAPDSYSATTGRSLVVAAGQGVLANDSDAEGSTLSARVISPPERGILTFSPDGSFTYTPAAGVSGTDSFVYLTSDGQADSAPATVTITVAAAPDPGPGPGPDTTGPAIASVERFGFHAQPTRFLLTFSEALTPPSPSAFRIIARGRDGRFGTADDVVVRLSGASYDASTRTVRLSTRRTLPLSHTFRLVVNGRPGGLADLSGNLLDGDGDGRAGGDAVVPLDRSLLVGPSTLAARPKGAGIFSRLQRLPRLVARRGG